MTKMHSVVEGNSGTVAFCLDEVIVGLAMTSRLMQIMEVIALYADPGGRAV